MLINLFSGRFVLDTRYGIFLAAPFLGEICYAGCGRFVRNSPAEIRTARQGFIERVERELEPIR
ncbi:MAG: hypothetical protein A4E20_03820 [Nitrospira sp. SG-bin2]|nr:MAG: hypothetical protein A4E20_03820 [Nitrospira sp. SG-bin2]